MFFFCSSEKLLLDNFLKDLYVSLSSELSEEFRKSFNSETNKPKSFEKELILFNVHIK